MVRCIRSNGNQQKSRIDVRCIRSNEAYKTQTKKLANLSQIFIVKLLKRKIIKTLFGDVKARKNEAYMHKENRKQLQQ